MFPVLTAAAFAVGLSGLALEPALRLPDYSMLETYRAPSVTRVYAVDGSLAREYFAENRVIVPLSAIPPYVIQAFISAEDQNFMEHRGVDPVALVRAAFASVRNMIRGGRLEGGSTITQQVVKNLLLSSDQTVLRKLREIILAIQVEQEISKERILELYLNEIYLGRGAYGVAAAAARYFGKSPGELTLAEAALLAALPKAPSTINPVVHPERALSRRNYVLDRMVADGAITPEEAEAAKAEPIEVRERATLATVSAPYFTEEVRRILTRAFGGEMVYEGGLTVRTTLDPRLQAIADAALREGLIEYDRGQGWRGPITNVAAMLDLEAEAQAVAAAEAEAAAAAGAVQPAPEGEATEDGMAAEGSAVGGRLLGALSAFGVQLPGGLGGAPAQPSADPQASETEVDDRPVWQRFLAEMERPPGGGGWQLAVVLEVDRDAAIIGLDDGGRGRIARSELGWARWLREDGSRGGEVRAASDVLARGDVIWVEPASDTPAPGDVMRAFTLQQVPEVSGALVAIEPFTGRILAMAGGFDYGLSEFNRVTQAWRQPGSAFKPFVYLAALEQGYTPATPLYDTPFAIEQEDGVYRPRGGFSGIAPLRTGVERSRNVMTIRLLVDIGMQPVADLAQEFGIYDHMPLLPSMGLGAFETTPLRLTAAYAMIANGGHQITPFLIDRVQDREGRTLYQAGDCQVLCADPGWTAPALPLGAQLTDPIANYQMISILQGVTQRGTAAGLSALGLPLAGKTGTTNDANDAWFVGFSPALAAGVYIGYDTPRSLGARASGGSLAVPIFGRFMREALAGTDPGVFRIPDGVSFAYVDRHSGYATSAGAADALLEAFRPGTEPGPPPVADTFGDTRNNALSGTGGLY